MLKGEKIGHMGTLDPMASGVLPVGVGKPSRLFQYLLDKEKTYVARFIFGQTTETFFLNSPDRYSSYKVSSTWSQVIISSGSSTPRV